MSVDRIPLPERSSALWLCGLNDIASDPEAVLASTSAGSVVCLVERRELEGRFHDYLAWLTGEADRRALWVPIRNFDAGSAAATIPVLEMIVDRLPTGVVVHCAMGLGRAGTIAVCLLLMLGVPIDEALETLADHRPGAGPGSSSQWALVEDVALTLNRQSTTGSNPDTPPGPTIHPE